MTTRCRAPRGWPRFSRRLFVLGLLGWVGFQGALEARFAGAQESVFSLDGWEKYDAPVLDSWFLVGPLNDEDVTAITSPETLGKLFPRAEHAIRGRLWQAAESAGGGVAVNEALKADGGWVLGLTFVNQEIGKENRLNFSFRGAERARVLVNGTEVLSLGAGESRREGAPFPLTTGWNRIVVLVGGGVGEGRFFVQITGEDGAIEPLYYAATLQPGEKQGYSSGLSVDRYVPRILRSAGEAIHAPYRSGYRRKLLILNHTLAPGSAKFEAGKERLKVLIDLSRLIAQGGNPEDLRRGFARNLEQLELFEGLITDTTAVRLRILERAKQCEAWLDPPAQAARWSLWQSAATARELHGRLAHLRRLLVDILEDARTVAAEVGAG